jgi:hypothetical protein
MALSTLRSLRSRVKIGLTGTDLEDGMKWLDKSKNEEGGAPWLLDVTGLKIQFNSDCESDFANGYLAIKDSLLCLQLGKTEISTGLYVHPNEDFCLVLK